MIDITYNNNVFKLYFANSLFTLCTIYIALMLVGLNKCLKQIIQIELNRVKNPSWPEANQLAINFTSMAKDLNCGLP